MEKLLEKRRNELIAKSKQDKKGFQRFKRRLKSRIATSTREYNNLDMTALFKNNILNVAIKVHGETDDYIVKISFGSYLDHLRKEIKDDEIVNLRSIIKAMITSFNSEDVYVRCSCPDFKFRFGFYATVNKYQEGTPQLIPSKETNPNDTLGSACKHVLLVLSNSSWIMKVASVVNNYIKAMEKFHKTQYDSIIYPALYGKKRPVQTSFIDSEEEVSENDPEFNIKGSRLGRGRKKGTTQNIANPSIRKIKQIDDQTSIFDEEEEEE